MLIDGHSERSIAVKLQIMNPSNAKCKPITSLSSNQADARKTVTPDFSLYIRTLLNVTFQNASLRHAHTRTLYNANRKNLPAQQC